LFRDSARGNNRRGGWVCKFEIDLVIGRVINKVFTVIPGIMQDPIIVDIRHNEGIPIREIQLPLGVSINPRT